MDTYPSISAWGCTGLLLLLCLSLIACQPESEKDSSASDTSDVGPPLPGKKLARTYCQSCHLLPDPKHLDRRTWKQVVLPRMGHRMGIYEGGERPDSLIEPGAAGRIVKEKGVFPGTAQLSREKWEKIEEYYLQEAPETLPPPPDHPEITVGLDEFRLRLPSFRRKPPVTTLVNIRDTALYVGSAKVGDAATVSVLDNRFSTLFEETQTLSVGSAPAAMRIVDSELYLTLMGQLNPTDAPSGRVVRTSLDESGDERSVVTLIDSLQRPVHTAYGDLTGDGREDMVVSEFGFRTGSLSWYEQGSDGQFERHILQDAPGATESVLRDFTGNGRLDVMALMAQGDEGIYLYRNQGQGEFSEEQVVRLPPSYGSSSFELVDFNGDGAPDILHTAGDNADFQPVMRPYHGVRIFLNDGENHFEEKYFYPLNGAYGAVARDFDKDGDLDIAATSFFPDYQQSPEESFVYLENKGDFEFEASTFRQNTLGRWIVLDSGDIEGDGDQDLLLGSFSALRLGSSYVPERLHQLWSRKGLSVVILENTTL